MVVQSQELSYVLVQYGTVIAKYIRSTHVSDTEHAQCMHASTIREKCEMAKSWPTYPMTDAVENGPWLHHRPWQKSPRCRNALRAFCRESCGRKEQWHVLYDVSAKTALRTWRCYNTSALTTDLRAYNTTKHAKRGVCSRHEALLSVIQMHCRESAGVSEELQAWPRACTKNASLPCCGGRVSPEPWTPRLLPTPFGACFDPARCSSFAQVSLVLQTTHAERVPLLLNYSHWFLTVHLVIFGGPSSEQCALCQDALSQHTAASSRGTKCLCLHELSAVRLLNGSKTVGGRSPLLFTTHAHTAGALLTAMKDARASGHQPVGLMYMHFDVLLNVRRFHGSPHGSVWTLRAGLNPKMRDPCCYPAHEGQERRVRGVDSYRSYYAAVKRTGGFRDAVRAVRDHQLLSPPLQAVCVGWSDLVYLPRRWVAAFASLLSGPLRHIHNELAVPTALHVVTGARRDKWRLLRCTGSASDERLWDSSLFPPTSFEHCGHRLSFGQMRSGRTDPYQQAALQSMLSPDWSPSTHCNVSSARYDRLRCISRQPLRDSWASNRVFNIGNRSAYVRGALDV